MSVSFMFPHRNHAHFPSQLTRHLSCISRRPDLINDWIYLAQDGDCLQALVNTVMEIRAV
jgi:hypothetical protein